MLLESKKMGGSPVGYPPTKQAQNTIHVCLPSGVQVSGFKHPEHGGPLDLGGLCFDNMSTETPKTRNKFRCGLKQHPVDEAIQLCRRLVNDVW